MVVTALLDDHHFLGVMIVVVPMALLDDDRLRLGRSRCAQRKGQAGGSQGSETKDELAHVQSSRLFLRDSNVEWIAWFRLFS
jgi:hypothetical protein